MSDYGRYCPVTLASDIVGDRWTLLLLRELLHGSTRFNDLARGLPGISRSLLVQRLRHLERRGIVELWPSSTGRGNEYHLTPAGKDLDGVIAALGQWAVEWMFDELAPTEIDAGTLMWWMHLRVDPQELPAARVVLQFDHTAPVRQSLWIVLDRDGASVCTTHPGADPDVVVTATTQALAAVFDGRTTWGEALACGDASVEGPRTLARAVPRWFLSSPFGELTRERATRA